MHHFSVSVETWDDSYAECLLGTVKPGQATYHTFIRQPMTSMITGTGALQQALQVWVPPSALVCCRQACDVCGH